MIHRLGSFMVNAVAPVFGFILSLWLIWNIETRFLPVVEDFTIKQLSVVPGGYMASGELNKSRNCEFVGLTLYAVNHGQPKVLFGQFKKDIFGADVGIGKQTWGPVTILVPPKVAEFEHLEIQGTHRCHALWLQTTEYFQLDLKGLPK